MWLASKNSFVIFFAFCEVFLLSSSSSFAMCSAKPSEAYKYDIGKYQTTDPKLLLYAEDKPIPLPFRNPVALALGANDTLYVAGDSALIALTAPTQILFRADLPNPPTCLAVAPDARVYVGTGNSLSVYDASGSLQDTWQTLGESAILLSLAVSSNSVFVADAANRVVMRFDLSGALQNVIGKKDLARGVPGIILPSLHFDIALAADGALWVANTGRLLVENYSPDGVRRLAWGNASIDIESFCGCCNPMHLAVMPDGSVVTSEKGLPRVKIYDPAGKFLGVVAGPESFDPEVVGLDLAVDSKGRILVLDPKTRTVRVFVPKTQSPPTDSHEPVKP